MRSRAATLMGVLVVGVGLGLLGLPDGVAAQPGKVPRVGYLSQGGPGPSALLDAFRRGLAELGYVEGRNIEIEYRYADDKEERLPDLAAELVRLPVDVIVTWGTRGVLAAKRATSTIPVVMAVIGDPVGTGVVASLARPGGNVTGLSLFDTELAAKRLELLREIVPGLSRVAALWGATDPGMTLAFNRVQEAAQVLGLQLQSLSVRDSGDFAGAFQAAVSGRAQALIVLAQPVTLRHRAQVLDLVTRQRLPAMYTLRPFVDGGGLMSYAANVPDLFRRAAYFVDRILKGARPASLPVEQPTKFELVINLRTARALGLAVPQSLLLRADQIIE